MHAILDLKKKKKWNTGESLRLHLIDPLSLLKPIYGPNSTDFSALDPLHLGPFRQGSRSEIWTTQSK